MSFNGNVNPLYSLIDDNFGKITQCYREKSKNDGNLSDKIDIDDTCLVKTSAENFEDDWVPQPYDLSSDQNHNMLSYTNFVEWKEPRCAVDFNARDDLYDSEADLSDEGYVNKNLRVGDKKTDAVLCCAACFTPVCYQCQRHELYQNQYRCIAVFNCEEVGLKNTNDTEPKKKDDATKISNQDVESNETEYKSDLNDKFIVDKQQIEGIFPGNTDSDLVVVRCKNCKTEVGMHEFNKIDDSDSIYHLYNVFPGEA